MPFSLEHTSYCTFRPYLCLSNLIFVRFCKCILGILRYKVDFQSLQADEPLEDVDLDDY